MNAVIKDLRVALRQDLQFSEEVLPNDQHNLRFQHLTRHYLEDRV